ncbi:MAG: AAA family ATPase, partial [Planctomycetota bacterium]
MKAIVDQVLRIQRMSDVSNRALAFYIAELVERTGWKEMGSPTLEHFAKKRLDMDRRRVGELRAVGLMLRDHPAIDETFRQHGIPWCKLVILARVVSPAHEIAWLARAVDHDLDSLKKAVRNSKPGGPPPKHGKGKGIPEVRYPIRIVHDAVTKRLWEQARESLSEELGAPVTDADAHRLLAERYLGGGGSSRPVYRIELKQHCVHEDCPSHLSVDTSDGPVPAATLDAPDRKTPAWMRALVLERDGVMCRNCGGRQHLQAHHVIFREDGGPTQLSNLACLCSSCHGLLHAGHLVAVGDHAATCRFEAPTAEALREVAQASQRAVVLEPTPPPAPRPEPLTLETLPARVDGDWWEQCADALRTGDGGRIDLVPGFVPPVAEDLPKFRREENPDNRAPQAAAFEGLRGRDRLVDRLEVWATDAESDGRPFPHALFVGPAGTGKTTLARAVAARMGAGLTTAMGNRASDPTTLLGLLAGLREGDALFLDEIHSLPRKVMELLYEAMTDQ